ncbi:DUF2194 domain-containing protein [Paenibacillus sp. GSMTC-2017]|uniref:DUF2194 domain-containing protein n=1 Tax=Paenibacillus sp. GSMTC-2017 TaxID=2794350 RepID=UPI0018D991D4|nr:DUF2194 domain-containing protein [Paenibacillus sp. GSMTC-2017]MBH5320705.1 DUF2194 domain-containing protein [Paenibacillus sp. GSMTC-2017]
MNKDVKFRRNVYIIMVTILALAILIQIARSQFVLQFNHNEQWLEERQSILEQTKTINEPMAALIEDEKYCIAFNSNNESSVNIKNQAIQTLKYMKRAALPIDLSSEKINYSRCTSVLVTIGKFEVINENSAMVDYVHNGGSVFLMNTPELDNTFVQIYRKLGIIAFDYAEVTKGIHLTSNVLIAEKGLKTGHDFIFNVSLRLELDEKVELLAESLEGIPLMWKREYGSGQFLVFNGDMLQIKGNRGLIAGAIGLLQADTIYPIFNSKVFFIDDFPAPIKKGLEPSIYQKYGVDIPTFYHKIWWPDMLKAAKRYSVKYTAAVIQSYNDKVTPPFLAPVDEERHNLIAYGREVIKSGGEIGLHGYNHQSLQTNKETANILEYNIWSGQSDMEQSIQGVLKYVDSAFPKYSVMSYVPPSNVLGVDGREALKAAWPNLTVISSLYDTDYSNMSYVQEFEIAEDGIIEMPRISSGYFETPHYRWIEANAMTSVGVFSHFVHPDDLLVESRSHNKSWEELYKEFVAMLERLDKSYPWLRNQTSTEAALDLAKTIHAEVKITKQDDGFSGEVTHYDAPLHYILRSERKIARQDNCSVKKIDENVYLVTVFDSKFTIGLGG